MERGNKTAEGEKEPGNIIGLSYGRDCVVLV